MTRVKDSCGIKFHKDDAKDAISISLCIGIISNDLLRRTLKSAGRIKEMDAIKERREQYNIMINAMNDEQLWEFYNTCQQDFDWILSELERRLGCEIVASLEISEKGLRRVK